MRPPLHQLPAAQVNNNRYIPKNVARGPPFLQRSSICNWLDTAAWLPRLQRNVNLSVNRLVKIIQAADHGQNFTRRRFQNNDRSVADIVFRPARCHLLPRKFLCHGVHIQIQACCHLPAATHQRVWSVPPFQLILNI